MDPQVIQQLLDRPAESHKYDFGHVLVWGGSPGMVGAPLLSAMAALRIGAGLVTIATSPPVIDKLEKRVLEIMTLRAVTATEIQEFIKNRKVSVLVIGPGMNPDNAGQVRELLKFNELPVIVDGGGLAAFNENLSLLNEKTIITPHAGEFQKLFNEKSSADRATTARDFAAQHHTHLVLKGNPTIVSHPNGDTYTNTTGGPALATAGSGDVLSGMIAGLIAQGIELAKATEAAVYLHGLAGDLAAEINTVAGVIASDVIENIPAALKKSAG